jgi:hypothetical protein
MCGESGYLACISQNVTPITSQACYTHSGHATQKLECSVLEHWDSGLEFQSVHRHFSTFLCHQSSVSLPKRLNRGSAFLRGLKKNRVVKWNLWDLKPSRTEKTYLKLATVCCWVAPKRNLRWRCENIDGALLRCGISWTCRWVPTFWRNTLLLSSRWSEGEEGTLFRNIGSYPQAHTMSQPTRMFALVSV